MSNYYSNIPEEGCDITHTIHDKSGTAYNIEGHLTPRSLLSHVFSTRRCVGRINWTISQPGVLTIADLMIFEPLDIKPWWARVFHKQPPNYKGRGLGSAMLDYIIESARAIGVSEIRGWMTHEDLKATPYLPAFYRKHGFTVDDDNLTFYQVLG